MHWPIDKYLTVAASMGNIATYSLWGSVGQYHLNAYWLVHVRPHLPDCLY
jgi:hypothetical protein